MTAEGTARPSAGAWISAFPLRGRVRLVVLSGLMLFVELILIRWPAESNIYLRYLTNLVLLASFLGVGVGFLRADAKRDLFRYAPVALALFSLFVVLFPVQQGRSGDVPLLRGLAGLPALPVWVSLPLIFAGAAVVMALIAEGVARTFRTFEALQAYRLDVLGSIGGIVGISLLAFLGMRPVVWILLACLGFLLVLDRPIRPMQIASLAGVTLIFAANSLSAHDAWSPYYKVTTIEPGDGRIALRVNGLAHQSMYPLDLLRVQQPFYDYAYAHLPPGPLDRVLVVGAGSGNDVAVALEHGARRVDAVEIDPVLLARGMSMHPENPYEDPRVVPHIDDGRAFLERTRGLYDLIVFALPDSMTLVSGQAGLRLESYLFTAEAFETVRERLRPDGVFSMYNYYRPDVFERYASTLSTAFGGEPCYDAGPRRGSGRRMQAVLTIGRDGQVANCETRWEPAGLVPEPSVDDHPFPYIEGRTIPTFYLVALALILLASAGTVRYVTGGSRVLRPYTDLFFMGAAFLLLETKNVVQFALLFGTTWFVNSLVFTGVLISVYLAIEVARRFVLPRPAVLYGGLFVCIAIAWAIPPEQLLELSVGPRFAVAIALAFAPIFVANLVFAQRFKETSTTTVAFGANLLGAMVGGVIEYAAIAIGYRALLLVVAAFYALAFVLERRLGRGGVEATASTT
jgi:SAM-dependent methyltransferase